MRSHPAIFRCHLKQLRNSSSSGSSSILKRTRWMDVSGSGGRKALRMCSVSRGLFPISWAWVGGAEPERIEVEFVQAAVRLVRDYFWPHSRAALRQIGLNERHANARRLLRWVRAHNRT